MSHIEETGRVLKMLNRLFRNGFKTKKSNYFCYILCNKIRIFSFELKFYESWSSQQPELQLFLNGVIYFKRILYSFFYKV